MAVSSVCGAKPERMWQASGKKMKSEGAARTTGNHEEQAEICIHHSQNSLASLHLKDFDFASMDNLLGKLLFCQTWPRLGETEKRLAVAGEAVGFVENFCVLPTGPEVH